MKLIVENTEKLVIPYGKGKSIAKRCNTSLANVHNVVSQYNKGKNHGIRDISRKIITMVQKLQQA
jgi:prefoldin subunit 5